MNEGFVFKYGGIQKRMPVQSEAPAPSGASEEPTKVCKGCGRVLPLSAFSSHPKALDGHMSECKECRRRMAGSKKSAQGNPLEKFTARQLMHELRERGYKGELEYVEVHKIRLSDM